MIRKIKNDSGYSLVELIIVLAIIAVMSGLAAVSGYIFHLLFPVSLPNRFPVFLSGTAELTIPD